MGAASRIRKLTYLLLTTFFLFTQASYAITIDKIVAFGDSLTDNGNLYALTKKANAGSPLIPILPKDPPYYNGRFSNGPVWVEELASSLNVPLADFAYGGAWAESYHDSHQIMPFGLSTQVNFYLVSAAPDFTADKHLFVIWAGANDYSEGRLDPEAATTSAITSIQNQIDALIIYGARNFLIMTIPDLSIAPAVALKGPDAVAYASTISQMHNRKLTAMVEEEKRVNSDVKFVLVDVSKMYTDVVTHPDRYLLKNVKDACYGGSYYATGSARRNTRELEAAHNANINIRENTALNTAYETSLAARSGDKACENPQEYLFWDHMHPTRVVHKIFATLLQGVLADNDVRGTATR